MAEQRTPLQVRLVPRGGRDAIVGWQEAAGSAPVLRVRVSAPPVDGKANRALIKLLSRTLGVPSRDVQLTRGQKSRDKTVVIGGLDAAEMRARIDAALVGR